MDYAETQSAVLLTLDAEGMIVIQTTAGMDKDKTLELLLATVMCLQQASEEEEEVPEVKYGTLH